MLINTVGRTGSGKSLYQAYQVYTECTRIMRNGKKLPLLWRIPIIKWFMGQYYSYYDVIGMNSEFNDGRGNTCHCDYDRKSYVGTGCILGVNDLPDVYNVKNCFPVTISHLVVFTPTNSNERY